MKSWLTVGGFPAWRENGCVCNKIKDMLHGTSYSHRHGKPRSPLNGDTSHFPASGAPLMATPIGDVSATTTSIGANSSEEKWLTAIKS